MHLNILLIGSLSFICVSSFAADKPDYHSHYIGQESRQIKSLSPDDIQQLEQGKGWGLAKAAELNGMPGPIHLLQMKKEINLSAQQQKDITALYDKMKDAAIPLGKQLVALEKKLNAAFASGSVDPNDLQQQLNKIADVTAQLRYVHLVAHLQTPAILTEQQLQQYNQLRGYHASDPCANVPPGHDAKMWKQHNGCS